MLAYKKNRKGSRKGSRKANRSASRKANRSASRKANRSASRKTYMRKNRFASRKASRSASRKTYMRKSRRCGMWGGAYNPAALSLAQGQDFNAQHTNQHGGAYAPLGGAPVGDQGLLPQELRDMARVSPVDMKNAEIIGMHDPDQMGGTNTMSGGRRRKSSRKNRKASRKNRKASRKSRKSRKNRRNQRGGARTEMGGAPYDSPNMLLSPSEAAKAGTGDFSNPLMRN
uniref:Uncharacterized protein n=1 Tax=viral metagenome TaxID=1070528 RepID=A0A6C0KQ37_9ZZZZ